VSSLWLIGGPLFQVPRERERERERGMEGCVGGWQISHGMDLLLAFEN